MTNPLTSWAGIVGLLGTVATILGAIGSACGAGVVCGYVSLAGLVTANLAHSFGNIASTDGKP